MPNMRYCRFQNTLRDLEDCVEVLNDGAELSENEYYAYSRLKEVCREYLDANEALQEDEEYD